MRYPLLGVFLALPLCAQQKDASREIPSADAMVVAVAHDSSVLEGGIGSGRTLPAGVVDVSPLAWITADGSWKAISCDVKHPKACKQFEASYLKKPHDYTVISADGRGANVHIDSMDLDKECFGYGGKGNFTGASVRYAAVAASTDAEFDQGPTAKRILGADAELVRKAFASTMGARIDSIEELRFYSFELEGQSLVVVQRAYQDYANKPSYRQENRRYKFIFAVGRMQQGDFKLLHWKENIEDENEQILGLIHHKSGKDFLVTAVSDPESQFYRIYGVKDGKLSIVFEGGGGGC